VLTPIDGGKVFDLRGKDQTSTSLVVANAKDITSDIASFRAVPGDRLEVQVGKVNIVAKGDHMQWKVSLTPTTDNVAADLPGWKVKGYVYDASGQQIGAGGSLDLALDAVTVIAEGLTGSGSTYTIVLVAEFDRNATGYNNTAGAVSNNNNVEFALKLANEFTVTATQVDPYPAA
jgi:hypothetical protein